MKKHFFFSFSFFCACALCFADKKIDLPLNGHFRSSSAESETAPGWIPDNAIGQNRLIPAGKKGYSFQEITASPHGAKCISSEFYPVSGRKLYLELKYSGSGSGKVFCFAYDKAKKQLGSETTFTLRLEAVPGKLKMDFPLPDGCAWVRFVLSAEKNSRIVFHEVEAEYLPAVQVFAAESSSSESVTIPDGAIVLNYQQKIFYRVVPDTAVYQASHVTGDDFEFKLGEEPSKGLLWKIVSYDPAKCRIKIEHEHKTVCFVNFDEAEIEIKPLVRGISKIELQCGAKKLTLYLEAL